MFEPQKLSENAEQQLRRYKQVLKVMPAGVILLDEKGRVIEANPESARLLGEPLAGQKWLDVIARAFQPQKDDGHEVSLKDGRRVQLAISASSQDQLILITDMTQTRLLQSKLSALQHFSSLGKMIAHLAHQIRTPLSAALLYASNLASPQLTWQKREGFHTKLLDRLKDIEKQIENMLFFAKGGDNKVAGEFVLKDLIAKCMSMVEAIAAQQNIDFALEIDNENAVLYGNENALVNALSNLIVNAIEASGKGGKVKLDAKVQNGSLYLSVTDNGGGILPTLQQQILEPFFTTKAQGTGLGLSVVQMICRAHQGQLDIQSNVNQGACFSLCLPIVQKRRLQTAKEKQNDLL